MSKTPHINRLIKLGLWGEEAAGLAKLLGKEQLELMLRGRDAIRGFENLRRTVDMREASPLIRSGLKRAKGLKAENQKKQHAAAAKYEMIQRVAKQLITANPKLQRASPNRLAIKIHKQQPHWPERTIRRALTPKK
jgi:hypothetical protein